MVSPQQIAWLKRMYAAAQGAGHKWPAAAACEAAAETGWGAHMPPNSNNVLGIKKFNGWTGPVVGAPGTEQNKDGSWSGRQADLWCVFASPQACFAQQVSILKEPRYAKAMAATTVEDYITEECHVWSTGQAKGQVVTRILHAHAKDLGVNLATLAAANV
jgi:flagellum-specific peptidoglycan hydrolase FlgJ